MDQQLHVVTFPLCSFFKTANADTEIVMVGVGFGDDFFEQDRSWDDFGTTISWI